MNINRVVLTGNLTKDPDMRSNPATERARGDRRIRGPGG